MNTSATAGPTLIVIFGVTGDLAKRKLLPALNQLFKLKLLHDKTQVVGITRKPLNSKDLIGKDFKYLSKNFHVKQMNITESRDYDGLLDYLNELEDEAKMCLNRLYYLSIPPQVFGPIIKFLGDNKLNQSCQHGNAFTRLLIEKPFGYDLKSAKDLIRETNSCFTEDQIFRIDHYLAKETVQNILTFRFNNAIFESLWNQKYISGINIVVNEKIDIEKRVTFYEQVGALRDMIQSHLFQLLALVTMDQPKTLSSADIHKAKLKTLRSVNKISEDKVFECAIRGQYENYRKEVSNQKSKTETYAAVKLEINDQRWRGVPIVLSTGKALSEYKSEISITFRRTNRTITNANKLTFRLQPNEGISIELCVKKPGFSNSFQNVDMDFSYNRFFKANDLSDAYEKVLIDAIAGDHTLFATSAEIIESWRVINEVINVWSKDDKYMHYYKKYTVEPKKLLTWLAEAKK